MVRVHYSHVAAQPCPCPTCRAVVEVATNTGEGDSSRPEPGSLVLCLRCGHPSVFAADMTLRHLLSAELRDACRDPGFTRAHLGMLSKRRQHRRTHGGGGDD